MHKKQTKEENPKIIIVNYWFLPYLYALRVLVNEKHAPSLHIFPWLRKPSPRAFPLATLALSLSLPLSLSWFLVFTIFPSQRQQNFPHLRAASNEFPCSWTRGFFSLQLDSTVSGQNAYPWDSLSERIKTKCADKNKTELLVDIIITILQCV